MPERVAIIGSREKFWSHPKWCERCVYRYVQKLLHPSDVVISGGASGPDTWGYMAAREVGMETILFLPDWEKHGKGAGFARNWQIIAACDRVVSFWDRQSRGTLHTMEGARSENKPVLVIYPEEHVPRKWLEPSMYAF